MVNILETDESETKDEPKEVQDITTIREGTDKVESNYELVSTGGKYTSQ